MLTSFYLVYIDYSKEFINTALSESLPVINQISDCKQHNTLFESNDKLSWSYYYNYSVTLYKYDNSKIKY